MVEAYDTSLQLSTIIPASLTVLSCLILVATLLFLPRLRRSQTARLVLWISSLELVWFTLVIYQTANAVCWVYATDTIFTVAHSGYTCVMAFHFLRKAKGAHVEGNGVKYHVVVWVVAAIVTIPIIIFLPTREKNEVTTVAGYCGNPKDAIASFSNVLPIVLITEVLVTFLFCGVVLYKLSKLSTVWTSLQNSDNEGDMEGVPRGTQAVNILQAVRNSRYLVVYVVCWTPRLVLSFYEATNSRVPESLNVVSNAFLCAIGFLDCVVYGTMAPDHILQRLIFHLISKMLNCIRCCSNPDLYEEERANLLETGGYASNKDTPIKKEPTAIDIPFEDLHLEKKIAKGATSIVYSAKYGGAKVAVKELMTAILDEEAEEAFRTETEFLAKLHHPYVVHFMGISETPPDRLFIVSEYCPHVLRDYMNKDFDTMPWATRLKVLKQIADAMSFLHLRGVLHRDLKPDNVLLSQAFDARIADFGLSKTFEDPTSFTTQTVDCGTPVYMAPEIADGHYGTAVDVYSFGIMFNEAWIGVAPYSHLVNISWYEMRRMIVEDNERPQEAHNMPDHFKTVVHACWHPNPEERPSFIIVRDSLNDGAINDDGATDKSRDESG